MGCGLKEGLNPKPHVPQKTRDRDLTTVLHAYQRVERVPLARTLPDIHNSTVRSCTLLNGMVFLGVVLYRLVGNACLALYCTAC